MHTNSTFAWYSATTSAAVNTSTVDKDSITTVTPSVTTNVSLDLAVTATLTNANLELAHYYAANALAGQSVRATSSPNAISVAGATTAAGLWTAYHLDDDASKTVYQNGPIGGSNVLFTTVTINVKAKATTVNGVAYSQDQVAALLAGQQIKLKVEADDGSRAKFWGFAPGTTAVSAPTAEGGNIAFTTADSAAYKLVENDIKSTGDGMNYVFGIYVEGVVTPAAVDSSVNGNFTVTVAAA